MVIKSKNKIAPISNASRGIKLDTLVRLRWLAILGQCITIIIVYFALEFDLPFIECMLIMSVGVILNIILQLKYSSAKWVSHWFSTLSLSMDISQLAAIIYFTGGLTNPFAIMLLAPVLFSAGSLPKRNTFFLGIIIIAIVILLSNWHHPLPWISNIDLLLPPLYLIGVAASVTCFMLFAGLFIYRLANETGQMAKALAATEIVLQREQHLSALDGLAAAAAHELGTPLATIAVVAGELGKESNLEAHMKDDLKLIQEQTARCRDILKRLSDPEISGVEHLQNLTIEQFIEEIIEGHSSDEKEIKVFIPTNKPNRPNFTRNSGVMYGLYNLIENAIDFAHSEVQISANWDENSIYLDIMDDGPGFEYGILDRLGEPYVSSRRGHLSEIQIERGGMGLGFFIARSMLARDNAILKAQNKPIPEKGAHISIIWDRNTNNA